MVTRNLCSTHYSRWKVHGDPLINLNPRYSRAALEERFASYIIKSDGCWLWTGKVERNGYGRFWYNGRNIGAHRLAYELWVAAIPDGLEIDHLCRIRNCVRPEHLEAVTAKVNMNRAKPWDSRHRRSQSPIA